MCFSLEARQAIGKQTARFCRRAAKHTSPHRGDAAACIRDPQHGAGSKRLQIAEGVEPGGTESQGRAELGGSGSIA